MKSQFHQDITFITFGTYITYNTYIKSVDVYSPLIYATLLSLFVSLGFLYAPFCAPINDIINSLTDRLELYIMVCVWLLIIKVYFEIILLFLNHLVSHEICSLICFFVSRFVAIFLPEVPLSIINSFELVKSLMYTFHIIPSICLIYFIIYLTF